MQVCRYTNGASAREMEPDLTLAEHRDVFTAHYV